jgi:acyl-CoA thioester hydrolase
MQETAFDASAAAGYDLDRYREIQGAWLVRETDIIYLRPLVYDDRVIVKTWVLDFRRVRSRRAYELRYADSGEIVAQATTDWIFLNVQTGRPETVPRQLHDLLRGCRGAGLRGPWLAHDPDDGSRLRPGGSALSD